MALSAMNKTSRARREILKIEKSLGGAAIDSIDVVTGDPIFRILIPRPICNWREKPTASVDGWMEDGRIPRRLPPAARARRWRRWMWKGNRPLFRMYSVE